MRNRFERIIAILKLLSSGVPYNPMQLAQETGANRRTIFRDISTLKSLGIPLTFDEEHGVYSLGEMQRRRHWVFQLVESLRSLDQNGFGTAYDFFTDEGRQTFIQKLLETLPDVLIEQLRRHLAETSIEESKVAESNHFPGWMSKCILAMHGSRSFSFKVVDRDGNKTAFVSIPLQIRTTSDRCHVECKNSGDELVTLETISRFDLSSEPEFRIFSSALRPSSTELRDDTAVSNGGLRH